MKTNITEELVKLLRESVIVQGVITLLVVASVMQMYVSGKSIPPDLVNLLNLLIGFWFGSKVTGALMRR